MPIGSIILQPSTDSVFAAYRPIVFQVSATKTDGTSLPPVVYCDVYINNIFYRTISKTQYINNTGTYSVWKFDIQDCCQEVLQKFIPNNSDSTIQNPATVIKSIYCKFRSSGIDTNGFIQPEGTPPIQGTSKNAPVAGTGTQSNTFWVLNAVLQHESNQSLLAHLNYFKVGTWDGSTYPLTERGIYKICKQDSDSFAIVSNKQPVCVYINYHLRNNLILQTATHCPTVCVGVSVGSYDLGTATNGVPYNVSIPLSGDAPFTLGTILNKPSWMTVAIITSGGGTSDLTITAQGLGGFGYEVTFSGTPIVGDVINMHIEWTSDGSPDSSDVSSTTQTGWTLSDLINDLANKIQTASRNFAQGSVISNTIEVSALGPGTVLTSGTNTSLNLASIPSGINLVLSGTPTADNTLSNFDAHITNCSGSGSIHITGNAPPCVGVTISSEDLPDAIVGESYSGSVHLLGTLPIGLTIIGLPPGLTATNLGGGVISITGIPSTVATGAAVSLRFTNCDGVINFDRTINVAAAIPPPDGDGTIHNGMIGLVIEDVLWGSHGVCTPYTNFPVPYTQDGTFSAPFDLNGKITVRFNNTVTGSHTLEIITPYGGESNVHAPIGGPVIISDNSYIIHAGDTVQINVF